MKIIHAADIHLGRRHIDGRLPDSDFAVTFAYIANQATAGKAAAFLLAGDLIDRLQGVPPYLSYAESVLAKLKKASIPVVGFVWNHDTAFIITGGIFPSSLHVGD
jgi:DNA repair exonuclease SbcCD nuclease subunit